MDWLGLIAGGIAFNVEWKIDVDGASIWIAVNINSDDDKDGVSEIQFSYPSVNGFICPGAGEEKEVDLGPSLLAFFRSLTTASFHIHITDCVHSTTLRSTHFIKLTQCCSCHPNSETRTLLSVLKYVNLALIQFVCDGWLDSITRFKHRWWKMRAPWSLSISSSFWGSVCYLQVPPPPPPPSLRILWDSLVFQQDFWGCSRLWFLFLRGLIRCCPAITSICFLVQICVPQRPGFLVILVWIPSGFCISIEDSWTRIGHPNWGLIAPYSAILV